MVKKVEDTPDISTVEETAPAVRKVTREERELGRLLNEIGLKYRDAGAALKRGDDVGFAGAMDLIGTYQELFGKLSSQYAGDITAEGLSAVTEM